MSKRRKRRVGEKKERAGGEPKFEVGREGLRGKHILEGVLGGRREEGEG